MELFISQKILPGTGIKWTGTRGAWSRAGQVRAVSLSDCVILGLQLNLSVLSILMPMTGLTLTLLSIVIENRGLRV